MVNKWIGGVKVKYVCLQMSSISMLLHLLLQLDCVVLCEVTQALLLVVHTDLEGM